MEELHYITEIYHLMAAKLNDLKVFVPAARQKNSAAQHAPMSL